MIERVPADQRALVLRVANGPGLRVAIERPAPVEPNPLERADWIESAVARYIGDGEGAACAPTTSATSAATAGPAAPAWRSSAKRPVRLVVPLATGGVVVAETVDELTVRVFGLPPGFWAGIIGFIVAALALYAVVRETKPLARLSRSVDRFGEAIEAVPVPERGAREVRALIGTFNRMQSRIAELVRDRTFMLAAISHDLRTYLTRLRLRVEMMPDGDMRERATRNVEEMNKLLEDALICPYVVHRPARESGRPVDIVLHECAERAAAGSSVQQRLPAERLIISGDPAALARIVGNLIDNALKYGREADVSVTAVGIRVGVMVDDRGPGIPASERERVRAVPAARSVAQPRARRRRLGPRHRPASGPEPRRQRRGRGSPGRRRRFRVSLPLAAPQ